MYGFEPPYCARGDHNQVFGIGIRLWLSPATLENIGFVDVVLFLPLRLSKHFLCQKGYKMVLIGSILIGTFPVLFLPFQHLGSFLSQFQPSCLRKRPKLPLFHTKRLKIRFLVTPSPMPFLWQFSHLSLPPQIDLM